MFQWFNSLKESIKINKANKKNFIKFKDDMQKLSGDDNSKFNDYRLIISPDRQKISMIITLPENFAQYPDDRLITIRLNEYLRPVSKYLLYDLNWFEYLLPPEILHIEETDENGEYHTPVDGEPISLTYIAVWKWQPVDVPDKHWRSKLLGMISTGIIVLGTIVSSLILFI